MTTMKACYYETFGPADKVLKLGQLPVPGLQGPNDVLVKVHAASINPADYKQCEGEMKAILTRPFPILPGFDYSGVVVKKGENVDSRIEIGQEVFGMIRGLRTGSTAEYLVVDEHCVSIKPKGVSHLDAAGMPLAAITAFQCLKKAGLAYPPNEHSASKSVFLTGGPGGVGTFIIQLAKKMFKVGTVVTTASAGEKATLCKSIGADEVVDYRSVDFRQALSGRRFDACIDCSGETSKMVGLVSENGGLCTILTHITSAMLREWLGSIGPNPGVQASVIVKGAINNIPSGVLDMFTGAGFIRFRLPRGATFHSIITVPGHDDVDEIAKFVESGEVKVIIDRVYPLDQAVEAYARSMSGKAAGKVIVQVI